MSKKYYEITGDFNLNITVGVENKTELPEMDHMKERLEDLFSHVVDNYLEERNLSCEEVHPILCSNSLYSELQDE